MIKLGKMISVYNIRHTITTFVYEFQPAAASPAWWRATGNIWSDNFGIIDDEVNDRLRRKKK